MLEKLNQGISLVREGSDFERFLRDVFGRMPANTQKAYRSDWNCYRRFCESQALYPIPAEAEGARDTMRAFLSWMLDEKLARATIDRRMNTVGTILQLMGAPNPNDVLFKKEVALIKRQASSAQGQAEALTLSDLVLINQAWREGGRREKRDCLMLNMAFDTMARASELAALRMEDVKLSGNVGTIRLRKSKTDQDGVGFVRFLSGTTLSLLDAYAEASGVADSGFIYRPFGRSGFSSERHVGYDVVSTAFKRAGTIVGKSFSTHSARVGATQEQIRNKVTLSKIMQAGGWKSSEMVARYGRELSALDAGMAELAELWGR